MENKDEVHDSYKEHSIHEKVKDDCSTCFSENRLIQSYKLVNDMWENLFPDNSRNQEALKGMIIKNPLDN